jgi:hypothetical protein
VVNYIRIVDRRFGVDCYALSATNQDGDLRLADVSQIAASWKN